MKALLVSAFFLAILFGINQDDEDVFVYTYEEGIALAQQNGKPIFLFFTGVHCPSVDSMNKLLLQDRDIRAALEEDYVSIWLNVTDFTKLPEPREVIMEGHKRLLKTQGNVWAHLELTTYNHRVQPLMLLVDGYENQLKPPLIGSKSKAEVLAYLHP